jgi:hypothetical protein
MSREVRLEESVKVIAGSAFNCRREALLFLGRVSTSANGRYYDGQIREKFHKLFLQENPWFVKHPLAQSRVAYFSNGF